MNMADIELVIKIPEDIYQDIIENGFIYDVDNEEVTDAIKNGTLLDLKGLKSDMKALNCGYPYGLDYLLDCLKKRLGITIIEADKAESEDKCKNCEYHRNPDYTRCHECKAESGDKERGMNG